MGNIGGLVAGFMKNDYELIGRSMKMYYRTRSSMLIPGLTKTKM
jgi:hypothetical protein